MKSQPSTFQTAPKFHAKIIDIRFGVKNINIFKISTDKKLKRKTQTVKRLSESNILRIFDFIIIQTKIEVSMSYTLYEKKLLFHRKV